MTALLIHGGAMKLEGGGTSDADYAATLRRIATSGYELLRRRTALDCVIETVTQLENDPIFNAGLGSRVQRDGQIRMSAALVDSDHRRFTGVVNIRNVRNPIRVAERLRSEQHGVLGGNEAMEFAFRNGFEFFDPLTSERWREHLDGLEGDTGTVGAIAVDSNGLICAGTSTGGIGNETAGRISDSATVAGVYASRGMGVCCTGRGEDIIRYAVAARVVAFHETGAGAAEAAAHVVADGNVGEAKFALIGLTSEGQPVTSGTTGARPMFAFQHAEGLCDFTELGCLGQEP